MTATARPSNSYDGVWVITLPPLTLTVSTLDLHQLVKWLNKVGCDIGEELADEITATFTDALPLTSAPCRWKGCDYLAVAKVTVNTINGDIDYDVCARHKQLIVP